MATSRVDRIGAWASSACAVHCALCALAPNLLVALGLAALLTHEAEWGLTAIAVAMGSWALVSIWRRNGPWMIGLGFALGLVGLCAARWLEGAGRHGTATTLAVVAGLTLVSSHIARIRHA